MSASPTPRRRPYGTGTIEIRRGRNGQDVF